MENDYFKSNSLATILRKIHGLGFYKSVPEVMNIRVRNAFEGFSGRASETWETQYEIEMFEVISDNGTVIIPADSQKGRTMEEACHKILARWNLPNQ